VNAFLQIVTIAHIDPVVPVLIHFSIILLVAKIGAEVFERINQPAVLGELVFGIIIGNLGLLFFDYNLFDALRVKNISVHWAVVVDCFSRIGVILLLFSIGLESTLREMKKVGLSSSFVAVVGVIVPFVLGFLISYFSIKSVPDSILRISPDFNILNIHIFIGAILTATSVGITARVFKDMGKSHLPEAKIIIGAAVIDDVLGLIILAFVSGMVTSATSGIPFKIFEIVKISIIALIFLAGSAFAGVFIIPKVMKQFAKMRTKGMMLISALLFCFILSILANSAGLATIVGAYAAGLILEEVHFKEFKEGSNLHTLLKPITGIFVPVFFIQMGIQVRLETFANFEILGIAFGLTLAAIIGKQACGLAVTEKGADKISIGLGMIPRGEVGLIFAGIGRSLGIIDQGLFSAVVIMVILTTLVTPPLLKARLRKVTK
jgi:Kef-type K+ transport system membrane component KefB